MRPRIVWTIFGKEILETLRDKRTLFVMVILPILLYPLIFLAMGAVMESYLTELGEETVEVAAWGEAAATVEAALEGHDAEGVALIDAPAAPEGLTVCEHAKTLLMDETADVVVVMADGVTCRADDADPMVPPPLLGSLEVLFDGASDTSTTAASRLATLLRGYDEELLVETLQSEGLDPSVATPYQISRVNLASDERMGGRMAGQLLPLLLVVMVVLGAFFPAIDFTAGEKERKTLETLMSSPITATEVVAGKYLGVVTIALIAALVNLVSMGLTVGHMVGSIPELGGTFQLGLVDGLGIFVLLIPVALLYSALMLALAVIAKDFKEAQSYLTPAYMVAIVPAIAATMPGVELNWLTMFAPGVNITLLIKEILMGEATVEAAFAVILSNTAYALLALMLTARLFESERVLFGVGKGKRKGVSGASLRERLAAPSVPGSLPSTGAAVVFFAVSLVMMYYFGSALQANDIISGLLITEWVLLLVPPILVALALKVDLRATFHLKAPSLAGLGGSILVGISGWSVAVTASALMGLVLPMPESFVQAMKEVFEQSFAGIPAPLAIFILALSPAVCEELAFRGIILAGFRSRLGRWTTVVTVGILFGAFHLSLYRFLPTALLGMAITFAVWQTGSLWTGMTIHFLSNGLVFAAGRFPELGALLGVEADGVVSWWKVGIFYVVFVVGLIVLWRVAPKKRRWGATSPR